MYTERQFFPNRKVPQWKPKSNALGHAQTALRKTQNLYFEAMNLMEAVKEDPYASSGYWGVEALKDQLLPMI